MIRQISADSVRTDFVFLSDSGHKVIDRYGLLNAASNKGWPHPTTLVIDKRGVVRWKFVEINYKVRPTNDMILGALAKLAPAERDRGRGKRRR